MRMLRILFLQSIACLLAFGATFGFCMENDFSPDLYEAGEQLEELEIYFETGLYERASVMLNGLRAKYPNEPRFEYLQAIVDYEMQNYDAAEKVFVGFIEKYPQVPEPYYLLGEINLKANNPTGAKQYFQKYCELVPEDYDARSKLNALSNKSLNAAVIIKDGKRDLELVEKVGFYGGCIHSYEEDSIKVVNGKFHRWSSMGIDFAYPLDLRGKQVVFKIKGRQGGERLKLAVRDKFAPDYNPQLILAPEEESLSSQWRKIRVLFGHDYSGVDLSQIVHMGLEFGTATVQNPVNATLFIKDIVIEDVGD